MFSSFYGKCKEFFSVKSLPSATVTDSEEQIFDQEQVQSLESMGFAKVEVLLALREAKGNVHIACEYLLTGLPQNDQLPTTVETIPECPDHYADCITTKDKLQWIESPQGQLLLKQRPILLEFYCNGQLKRMINNRHWDKRLLEWLQPSTTDKKLEKQLTIPRRKKKRTNLWFNAPLSTVPANIYFQKHLQNQQPVPLSSKYELLVDGYCIFKNIIPLNIITAANAAIDGYLSDHFTEQRRLKAIGEKKEDPTNIDAYFLSGSTNHLDVMALFYASPVFSFVQSLLYGDHRDDQDSRQSHCGGAQIAFRFSQPRGLHWQELGGTGWHLDGLEDGRYSAFSLLIGVALNDQLGDFSGNLCLHKGSHNSLRDYLKTYATQCRLDARDDEDCPDIHVPKPDLGEPEQIHLSRGDVVFAMHKTAHRGGPNYSHDLRRMVYFRVNHVHHGQLKLRSLDDIWVEFEGMREVL
mmetsp:Transcript_13820/g.18899  ORF Transcript_13820/g.18899 Transcript_13820/m.18899 type:complete len:466 (-) Transcript_13820:52-1449(-)